MAEAYAFGLPGYQKPLVSENYRILNTKNVATRRTATLGTRNVLLVCDYYTYVGIGALGRSLSTDLCDANMRLTQPWVQHSTLISQHNLTILM